MILDRVQRPPSFYPPSNSEKQEVSLFSSVCISTHTPAYRGGCMKTLALHTAECA